MSSPATTEENNHMTLDDQTTYTAASTELSAPVGSQAARSKKMEDAKQVPDLKPLGDAAAQLSKVCTG